MGRQANGSQANGSQANESQANDLGFMKAYFAFSFILV